MILKHIKSLNYPAYKHFMDLLWLTICFRVSKETLLFKRYPRLTTDIWISYHSVRLGASI